MREEYFTTKFWWAPIRHWGQIYLSYPPCEWYITYLFWEVCQWWGLLLWLWRSFVKMCSEQMSYNMVGRFAMTHGCGWFLYVKIAVWLNEASECLFPYRWSTREVHWEIMGLTNVRKLTRKDNKYNKDFKWLQWDSNTRRLSLKTNTQPLSITGKIIELCC